MEGKFGTIYRREDRVYIDAQLKHNKGLGVATRLEQYCRQKRIEPTIFDRTKEQEKDIKVMNSQLSLYRLLRNNGAMAGRIFNNNL